MKLSNFEMIETTREGVRFAEVDVTTGSIFKKTKRVKVFSRLVSWAYLDGSDYTPGNRCELLAQAWQARADWEAIQSNMQSKVVVGTEK